jgi:hypothetical protein
MEILTIIGLVLLKSELMAVRKIWLSIAKDTLITI